MARSKEKEKILDNINSIDEDEMGKVLQFYQQNPTLAADEFFEFKHGLPWHQRLALKVTWNNPNAIQIWTRGGGKTFFLAFSALLAAMLYPNEKIGIFGPSFRQSKFVWAEIERLYERCELVREFCIKRPMSPPDKCSLMFKNGSIIEALPLGDGKKIRGARYYRIFADEAAQIPEDIFDIVIRGMGATNKDPMEAVVKLQKQQELLSKGLIKEEDMQEIGSNRILMTSTAFYRFNHLWKRVCLFQDQIMAPENAHLHPEIKVPGKIMWNDERALLMFTHRDPPRGFMNEPSIKEAKLKMSEMKFKMEYEAYFPPDSEGFFRRSKLERARNHSQFTVERDGDITANYVMGIDVARKSDNFSICVGKIVDDKLQIVRIKTLNSRTFSAMHDMIRETLDEFKIIHICADDGGGGTAIQDMLMDKRLAGGKEIIYDSINNKEFEGLPGLHILDMVKFSDDSIPVMAHQMQADLDHGRLLLPCIPARYYKQKDNTFTGPYEEMYDEIEAAIEETTSIVSQATRTGRLHLGLPGEIGSNNETVEDGFKAPRKDRWTAMMLCNWAKFRSKNGELVREKPEIAYGFALGNRL